MRIHTAAGIFVDRTSHPPVIGSAWMVRDCGTAHHIGLGGVVRCRSTGGAVRAVAAAAVRAAVTVQGRRQRLVAGPDHGLVARTVAGHQQRVVADVARLRRIWWHVMT